MRRSSPSSALNLLLLFRPLSLSLFSHLDRYVRFPSAYISERNRRNSFQSIDRQPRVLPGWPRRRVAPRCAAEKEHARPPAAIRDCVIYSVSSPPSRREPRSVPAWISEAASSNSERKQFRRPSGMALAWLPSGRWRLSLASIVHWMKLNEAARDSNKA